MRLLAACLLASNAIAPTHARAQDGGVTCAILSEEVFTLYRLAIQNVTEMRDKLRRAQDLEARLSADGRGLKLVADHPFPEEVSRFEDFDFNFFLMVDLSLVAKWQDQIAALTSEAEAARKRAIIYRNFLVKLDGLADQVCTNGGTDETEDRRTGGDGIAVDATNVGGAISNPLTTAPANHAGVCNPLIPYIERPISEANLGVFLTQAEACANSTGSPTVLYNVCYCSEFQGEPCPSKSSGYGYCRSAVTHQKLVDRVGGIFKRTAEACAARGADSVYCDPIKVVMMPYPPGTPVHEIPGPPKWNE